MDPTLKRQNKPTSGHPTTARNPPQKPFYLSNPLSKLTQKTKKPPPTVDTQLQAKSLTVSADFDGKKLSTLKPKQHQQLKRVEPRLEKEVKVKKEEKKKEVKDVVDVKRMNVSIEGIGRRRSFSGSQIELADFLANNGAKIVAVDMPPFMQIHAVDRARKTHDSLEKFTSKTLALTLKKEFDGVYGPAWHCIVGTSFGSFVTHSVGGFLYFSMDQKLYVLLFKTSVQRAD